MHIDIFLNYSEHLGIISYLFPCYSPTPDKQFKEGRSDFGTQLRRAQALLGEEAAPSSPSICSRKLFRTLV